MLFANALRGLKIYWYIFRESKNHYICIATLFPDVMKRFSVITTFISVAVVMLLCVWFGVFSYIKLKTIKEHEGFDLYMLVPPSAVIILDTDSAPALPEETNALSSSTDNQALPIPQLLANLKQYYTSMTEETSHGLSKRLNKVLVSFHEPDNSDNQVFYCRLGGNDSKIMERFIVRY
ncbi:hypothetical protein EZS27_042195, partial [termite gut metagenome]